jgi:threonine dehydratase
MNASDTVTAGDVAAAARRLAGVARLTPLLHDAHLDEVTGGRILLKAEPLQVGGAFKIRGAYNRMAQIEPAARAAGVVAWSSGNHAQGVAAAGRRLDMSVTIVMPADAPLIKVENTRRLGAEIVSYDRATQDREEIGQRLARERGATLVRPYDDPYIIAGQGTVGLEIIAQARESYGAVLDALLVPCGGGGLSAGCALAFAAGSPATRIHTVEPQGFDDTARSLASGERQRVQAGAHTLCDALMPPTPGELTLPILRRSGARGLVVNDAEVLAAMQFAWRELKIVVEPGGVVGLAALLHGKIDCRGRTVGVVLSGGNVDAEVFTRALQTRAAHHGAGL